MPDAPPDAAARRAVAPVICYPTDALAGPDSGRIAAVTADLTPVERRRVPPRDAATIAVPKGHVLRIECVEGPQVGDLNLFAAGDLSERFYAGKTRALHGSHLSTGDRLWSGFPQLRPMATITADSLEWYGCDAFGGRVHDVIGTRCDPYTARLLSGRDYDRCCHSNLTRALAAATGLGPETAEALVHDVLNVFMCTGFTKDTGQYFMKASPVRPGDRLDLLAEIDLLAALSTCPGGDCGSAHSSDAAQCHPIDLTVLRPATAVLENWREPAVSGYGGMHGL